VTEHLPQKGQAEVPDCLSGPEFIRKWGELSEVELADVQKAAKALAIGLYSQSNEDLLNAAIMRGMRGKCPRNVKVVAFLITSMKGFKIDAIRRQLREVPAEQETIESQIDTSHNPESGALLKDAALKILELFADNPTAQKIVIGLIEGKRGAELQNGLDKVTYASLRRLIGRRIERYWRNSNSRRKRV
jgi:hypothetical protein